MNSRIICLMFTMCQALGKKLNKYLITLLRMIIIFNEINYFTGTIHFIKS